MKFLKEPVAVFICYCGGYKNEISALDPQRTRRTVMKTWIVRD